MPVTRLPLTLFAALALLASLGACGASEPASGNVVVRDSAGVRIIENATPAWNPGEEWRLSASPVLDIGVLEGAPEYQLHRVGAASRLRDGRIAVANGGSSEIRLFDPHGRFLRAIGREGAGPGEFRSLDGIWPYRGDSILAWDGRLKRVSVFTGEGEFARDARVRTDRAIVQLRGAFPDGSLLLSDWLPDEGAPAGRAYEMETLLVRSSPEGVPIDTLGRFPLYTGARSEDDGTIRVGPAVFGAWTHVGLAGERVFVGTGKRAEVEIHAGGGGSTHRIRWADEVRPVTGADIERYKAWRLAGAETPEERARVKRQMDLAVFAPRMRAYATILVDRTARLWVARHREIGADGPIRWMVFDQAGRWLGDVATPDGLRVLEVGEDYVVGVEHDDFGVERVRVYRLLRGPR